MSPSVVGVFALLFFVVFAFERPAFSAPAPAAAFSAPAASVGCRAGSAVVSADPSEDGGSAGALLREGFLSCCSTPLVSKSCGVKIRGREGERALAMRAPRGGTRATTMQARPGKSDFPRTHLHRRRTTLALPRDGRGRRRDRGRSLRPRRDGRDGFGKGGHDGQPRCGARTRARVEVTSHSLPELCRVLRWHLLQDSPNVAGCLFAHCRYRTASTKKI